MLLVGCGQIAAAQDDALEQLVEGPPTDLVVLRGGGEEGRLEMLPLEFPGGSVPDPLPQAGSLVGRLIDRPQVEVEIAYSRIERVVPHPQRLLDEATRAIADKRFEPAYDLLHRLRRDYADFPGSKAAGSTALRSEALERFKRREFVHSLALLQTLHDSDRTRRGLADAVDRVADALLAERVYGGDYAAARATIEALGEQFGGLTLDSIAKWEDRLGVEAERLREEAVRLAGANQPRAAMRAAQGAAVLQPGSAENRRLVEQLTRQGGALWVGVSEAAPPDATPGLDRPVATRQARLVGGRLAELTDYSPTGAEHRCVLGEAEADAARRRLKIHVAGREAPTTAAGLARSLLAPAADAASPLSLLRARTSAVSIESPATVLVELATPHPTPVALLDGLAPPTLAEATAGAWRSVPPDAGSDAVARYESRFRRGVFRTIEEFVYGPDEALEALRVGELHAVADVLPWRLDLVESTPEVRLVSRRLPTLHVLLIGPDSPLARSRPLRRAIDYAIAREQTLNTLVLGGASRPGFEPLSGPFPRGLSLSDTIRYAYDDRVEPRDYEPRLAALLVASARAAAAKAAAESADEDAPPNSIARPLRLGHPATPLGRRIADALAGQLGAVGLEVEPFEASETELASGETNYDLRYAQVTLSEPMVDAWPLLGPGGVAGTCSPATRVLLDRLQEATTGAEAAAVLRELHRLVATELPLISLWQTVDHFAVRKDLIGVADEPVAFYQSVEQWRLATGGVR